MERTTYTANTGVGIFTFGRYGDAWGEIDNWHVGTYVPAPTTTPVTATRATTWVTKANVTATRATTWNCAAAVAKPPVHDFSSANLSLAIGSSGSDVFSAFTVAAIVRKSVDHSIPVPALLAEELGRDDLGSPRGDERQPHAGQQPERRVQGQRPDVDGCRWLVAAGVDAQVHQ